MLFCRSVTTVAVSLVWACTSGCSALSDRLHSTSMGRLELLAGSVGPNFYIPHGLVVDPSGNVYVADSQNQVIRRIDRSGRVFTVAGNANFSYADGAALEASFRHPRGLAMDRHGDIYIADTRNHLIRRLRDGVVTTLAGNGTPGHVDGQGNHASFDWPQGIAVDPAGNLVVTDSNGNTVRRVTPDGRASTIAGSGQPGFVDGPAGSAQFNQPAGVTVDLSGAIFIADEGNHAIRKIGPDGLVGTLAGNGGAGKADGVGRAASFNHPLDLAFDEEGGLFVADERNDLIRRVSPNGGVSTYAGGQSKDDIDGSRDVAGVVSPFGISGDGQGNFYFTERSGFVRRMTIDGTITTVAHAGFAGLVDGPGGQSRFYLPQGLAADSHGNIFVADTHNNVVRQILPDGRAITLAGTGRMGHQDGPAEQATFDMPSAVAVDNQGNVYVADTLNNRVRKISAQGIVSTLAGLSLNPHGPNPTGDGPSSVARLNTPVGLAVDASGNVVVADSMSHRIRKISPDGLVTTVAGGRPTWIYGSEGYDDGDARTAQFNGPTGIAMDPVGKIYVADCGNNAVREISPDGNVSTLAGGRRSYLAVHAKETREAMFEPGGRVLEALRQRGGFADGQGDAAEFSCPAALSLDAVGNLYVVDRGNRAIRKISPEGKVTTLWGATRGLDTELGELPSSVGAPQGIAVLPDGQLVISVPNAVIRTRGAKL